MLEGTDTADRLICDVRPNLSSLIKFISSMFRSRLSLQTEIMALHQQLFIYKRKDKKPQIKPTDRMFWSWFSKMWAGWKESLYFVKPATVIAWRRRKFRAHWAKLTRNGKPGRSPLEPEIIRLIRDMSKINPLVLPGLSFSLQSRVFFWRVSCYSSSESNSLFL